MQQATPSEILIFQKLANPARVSRVPKDPVKKPEDVFKHAVQDEMRRSSSHSDDGDNRRKEEDRRDEHRDERRREESSRDGHRDERRREESREYDRRDDEDERRSERQEEPKLEHRLSDEEAAAEHEREKLGMIDFINKKAMRGVRTTKNYTRDDPFDEIQFEYDRIKTNEETNGAVNLMREGLRFLCQGVEMGNEKFGPILSLNRWVETKLAPETMSRFDPVLEKLYKKHWRKGSMAPELELLMLVGGSMAMHHFETVRGGGASKDTPAPFARQHSAGPTTPFNLIGAMMSGNKPPQPPHMQHTPMQPQMQQHQMQHQMPQQNGPPPPPGGRPVMRGPVDHRAPPPPPAPQIDELMQAQDAQMRALQQRAMMLAARQRELDALEARMERNAPPPRSIPPMFVISSMKQMPQTEQIGKVEIVPSDDERSVAISEDRRTTEAQSDADAQSVANSEVESQASSTTRRRKNYTTSRRKNKLRV